MGETTSDTIGHLVALRAVAAAGRDIDDSEYFYVLHAHALGASREEIASARGVTHQVVRRSAGIFPWFAL
ncbi:hypothetical protein [Cryobacterium sp. Y29]|uniref:hypothetical protein n=1 Tax=Cryobacterium sp. Y29 TaxID=2048285 RepID=UPI000CE3336C|nr:hypothetical protein [Cryobacterium sp. Y29]